MSEKIKKEITKVNQDIINNRTSDPSKRNALIAKRKALKEQLKSTEHQA